MTIPALLIFHILTAESKGTGFHLCLHCVIVYSYFRLYIIMRFLSITFRLLTEKKDFS